MKLNYISTPEDVLYKTMENEAEKAKYWFERWNTESEEELVSRSLKSGKKEYSEPVEYHPTSDNRWLVFRTVVAHMSNLGSLTKMNYVCYWECDGGGIGCFSFNETSEGKNVYVLSPHFFARYKERMRLDASGMELLLSFFTRNGQLLLDDDVKCVNGCGEDFYWGECDDGMIIIKQRGDSRVYDCKTFLREDMLFSNQLKSSEHCREFFKGLCSRLYEQVNELYHEDETLHIDLNTTYMTDLIIQNFKRTLKSAGVKNFETLCLGAFDLNYNRYIELVEPLYVISRIMPYANMGKDAEKLTKANKMWVEFLVEHDICKELRPFTEKYGKELVSLAIDYAIDHGLWESPKGNASLKTKHPNHWDGLNVIDEVVEYLVEEDPSLKDIETEEPDKVEEPKPEPVSAPSDVIDFGGRDEVFSPTDIAMALATDIMGAFKTMTTKIDTLNQLIADNKELEEMDSIKKSLEREKEKCKKLTMDRDQAQANYNLKSKDYDAMKREMQKYRNLYEDEQKKVVKKNTEIEELKKNASTPLQRKKQLKLSQLCKLSYMGTFDKPSKTAEALMREIFPMVDVVVDRNH